MKYYSIVAIAVVLLPAASAFEAVTSPTGLVSWHTENGVQLEWNAPADGTPDSYRIYRSIDFQAWTQIGETATESFLDVEVTEGILNGTIVFYYVTAVDAGVESGPSNPSTPGSYPHCTPLTPTPPFLRVGCFFPLPPPIGPDDLQFLLELKDEVPVETR